jgi:putative PIN family toxin of toxin-antitoxin system
MRVMLDTNVIISALLFPSAKMNAMMQCVLMKHRLVLSSYVVDELKRVVRRKFPQKEAVIDKLLTMLSFEYAYTPEKVEDGLFYIRDIKDYPVLYTAILEDVDVLVTGDRDFADIDIEKPEIMTPAEFIEKFLSVT